MFTLDSRRGFTLVELLVVVFIIGVLVALLLPAIQAAREAARRTQCRSQLKQLALAAITHQETVGHYPTGGWGGAWVGDRDRGFDDAQPGNWLFNALPFLEAKSLYDLAGDGLPDQLTPQQLAGAKRLVESPISIINCPSRRPALAYPVHDDEGTRVLFNAGEVTVTGRPDYAACFGDLRVGGEFAGNIRLMEDVGTPRDAWCYDSLGYLKRECYATVRAEPQNPLGGRWQYNGVSFARSMVRIRHVTDGASKTYLIGEKQVRSHRYEGPFGDGDNWTWVSGHVRNAYRNGYWPPAHDSDTWAVGLAFGSAHPAGLNMAYCDGSVHFVDYDVAPSVHRAAANRHDGTVNGAGMSDEFDPLKLR